MSNQVADALAALRDLGTPQQIRALADRGYGPAAPPSVNAHIHLPPNFSAFESVEQAVDLAAAEAIGVLGVSNYYDYTVYGDFAERARARAIFPLFGLEIIAMQEDLRAAGVKVNDPGNPGKTYLCGKGITRFEPMSPEATRLIELIRENDSRRMATMIDRMRQTFDEHGLETDLDAEAVRELVVRRHGSPPETVYLQERHASQAFQETLFERVSPQDRHERLVAILGAETKVGGPGDHVAIQNDIRSHLMKTGKTAFVEEDYLNFEEAQQLILELGGIPSYPTLADGATPMCPFEADPDELVRQLQSRNVHAAEWIPPRNKLEVLRRYVTRMRTAGLVVTAGTEHNTLDVMRLDPHCLDGDVPDDLRSIFWEGACVVSAHQFMTLHGECGFVDSQGNPHADYGTADDRIRDFALLGAAVIQRYYDACAAASQRG
jgi:hypothetical protein